ncbi:putative transmembrane protein [Rhizobium freirei PRF 81]|uniref:Putative transmembrane protein n=1 Tax=Rhizobium freirei PRF 81 TaxID=363754 RepID=N6U4M1_9HYPH|nr:hypothetical protein [Rhizobium freirei]ENN85278.1 putative transmembrane protein [Rhizobium freirei PRF 81]
MIKKTVLTVLLAATVVGGTLAPANFAQAQQYYRYHHHHHNGGAIAGGVAAGLLGGLIVGGALANRGPVYGGPVYEAPPRCWLESRPVPNRYDDGYHYERVRVCD